MAVTERPFEWERHLPRLCLAYNTSVHPTTGYSPFFLMFGRLVRMPIDIMYGTPTPRPSSTPKYVKDLCGDLESAYERVRVRMGEQLDRRSCMIERPMENRSSKVVWCGYTPQQSVAVNQGSCNGLGWGLTVSLSASLRQYTASTICSNIGNE